MQLLPDDEKPVLLMKNVFSDSHMFAFIYSPHVKASKRGTCVRADCTAIIQVHVAS